MYTHIHDTLSDCICDHINATNAIRDTIVQYKDNETEKDREVAPHKSALHKNHAKALEIVRAKGFTKVDLHKEAKQAETDRYSALARKDAEGVRGCELVAHFFRTLICRM